jgi:hypothetical protein
MRLEHVCDLELTYRREPLYDGLLQLVAPYGTQEGSLYGEGGIVFRGARLSGEGRWANHARRRSDGVNLPDVHGVLRTGDGAFVLFAIQGRTLPAADGKRRQLLTVWFEAEDDRYRCSTRRCAPWRGSSSPGAGRCAAASTPACTSSTDARRVSALVTRVLPHTRVNARR